ncbi:hypothetical protein BpHYR1_016640 [Brachionus plicatilis]|uniref:Uncharacterized protein n=1 Tax=Brachionus plicatilis TaxID=10195 RepID=A0A3M7Q4I5_BRAPC|nr:hypothetical protein BpHYR1_016640 [Brachionus plicatilis]
MRLAILLQYTLQTLRCSIPNNVIAGQNEKILMSICGPKSQRFPNYVQLYILALVLNLPMMLFLTLNTYKVYFFSFNLLKERLNNDFLRIFAIFHCFRISSVAIMTVCDEI